jgi:hypothetical protein
MPAVFGSTIGPIVAASDVERAALATIKKWVSTYLGEAEGQHDRARGSLPRPRSYTTTNSFDKWPEDQLPCVLLVCPGLVEQPRAEGNGHYHAVFAVGVAVIVSAKTEAATEELAKLYVSAVRTCLIQQQSLGGFADSTEWLDETYDDLPSEDMRSLGAGQSIFAVHVGDLSRRYTGPPHPVAEVPVPPYGPMPDDPTATDVAVSVKPKS